MKSLLRGNKKDREYLAKVEGVKTSRAFGIKDKTRNKA
jgi:hypothetical protein